MVCPSLRGGPCQNYALPENNQQEQGEKKNDYGDATTNVADNL